MGGETRTITIPSGTEYGSLPAEGLTGDGRALRAWGEPAKSLT